MTLIFKMTFIRILRCCNFTGSLFSLKVKRVCHAKYFHSRIVYNMRTAYFQHAEGEEKVHVTLNFNELNNSKVLNFERNILEKLTDFVAKLDHRLTTLYTKKSKKKTQECLPDLPERKTFLFLNNEEVSERLVFQDLFQNNFNGDLKLRILDNDYDIVINSPLITSMNLPDSLHTGCFVALENFKAQSTDYMQSQFTWYRSKFPTKQKGWEVCGEGPYYKVKEDDEGYYFKVLCIPKLNEKAGPGFEVISQTSVKKFENFDVIFKRHAFTEEKTKPNEFRIVSYNILADMYVQTKEAKSQIFTFCNPLYLDCNYRKNLLNIEVEGYNADILCMQEVERKFYNNNIVLFNKWGYESLYHEKRGTKEGSAILFDKKKFNLETTDQYIFSNELLYNSLFSDIKSKIESNTALLERLQVISSQIQVAVLEYVSNNNILVVGNVHLYFHPDADHIRLLQGVMALRILQNQADEIKETHPNKKVSIVLCGDFNSTPECGFHQLLSTGSVDSSHIDWKSKEEEQIKDVSCSHLLKMKSCYDHSIFTNYVPSFKACIDYIYFQSDHLELKQTVPVPSEDVLSKSGGIPSEFLPSDHVALIADLKFKDNTEE